MENLASLIRDIPDFPEPGIVFKDITPVLADSDALARLIDGLASPYIEAEVGKVAGIEARGFTLASPVAGRLGAGFIPVRKPGKLPHETIREEYSLEYGTDALEVHVDAVRPGERVLLVDDVIATGGTASAAIRLLRGIGAEVVGFSVFIELAFLRGRELLNGVPLHALVRYD
ncbi:MAG: adenine phosphoribosyltransferase [Actinobacteria bacterium]|nr:adenine phosphoribosyltransferase [Actinomycetota bacterium]MCI0543146.1 adenine phosphoribosyltransferase [Actinomycetota bacterium]MCI0678435.1 adenine phosphoribosyltransferase [Actinomycetota bacterium]